VRSRLLLFAFPRIVKVVDEGRSRSLPLGESALSLPASPAAMSLRFFVVPSQPQVSLALGPLTFSFFAWFLKVFFFQPLRTSPFSARTFSSIFVLGDVRAVSFPCEDRYGLLFSPPYLARAVEAMGVVDHPRRSCFPSSAPCLIRAPPDCRPPSDRFQLLASALPWFSIVLWERRFIECSCPSPAVLCRFFLAFLYIHRSRPIFFP